MVELPFLKKKGPEVIHGKGFVPVDRVKELASKGFSEVEIIDTLRKEGFSPKEIDEALTQAIKTMVTKEEPKEIPRPKEEAPKLLPTFSDITVEEKKEKAPTPELPETSLPEEYYYEVPSEEYIDAIIEARVSELKEKLTQISTKYEELEKKIETLTSNLNELFSKKSEEYNKILDKIEELTKSFDELSLKVGAVEKAFKEALPALIESVRALSDLVARLKS